MQEPAQTQEHPVVDVGPEPLPEPLPAPGERPRLQYTPEQQALFETAMQLANDLGETERGPRTQVARVVRVLGIERAQDFFEQTLMIEATGGMLLPNGSRRRTSGGVFFKIVRDGMSKEERWKFFSMRRQGDKPEQATPAHHTLPAVPSAAPVPRITEIPNATGEARTVKITLVGRPGRIITRNGYIMTTMQHSKVPVLPKGMPVPPTKPTTYTVYISAKQWQKVAASLQGNPEDVLIAEGTPVYDADLEGIAVYVTNTRRLQQAQRTTQAGA